MRQDGQNTWQQDEYLDRCDIYRENTARAAKGQLTHSLVASSVACKHFTSPNIDSNRSGISQIKADSILTDDILHMDLAQDIRAEDYVKFTTGPTVASGDIWFRVAGSPESRRGIANRSAVYLVPAVNGPQNII